MDRNGTYFSRASNNFQSNLDTESDADQLFHDRLLRIAAKRHSFKRFSIR